ncbi:MAG: isochorismate synthase, partial [Salinigranum sp.]
MEPPRSEEAADRRSTDRRIRAGDGADVPLVSRSARVAAPPFGPLLSTATGPRTLWTAPAEATVVGDGAAATVTAEGPNRFERVRKSAARLFAGADVDVDADAARPRLFGGFAFHDDATERHPWVGFPAARFVLPRVQVVGDPDGDRAWLTVNAVGPEATPAAVEGRLADERERLESLEDPGPVAGPPGISVRRRTTAPDDWRRGVEAAVERIRAGDLRKVV